MKIYMFFDSVHLIKNIRKNLLNRKRFLFPAFLQQLCMIMFVLLEVKWVGHCSIKFMNKTYSYKQIWELLLHWHPRCSILVTVSRAYLLPSQSSSNAIQKYFPEKKDAARFLHIINVWWTISNAKVKSNSRYSPGNSAVAGDGKSDFIRELADWIHKWDELKIPRCEKIHPNSSDKQCIATNTSMSCILDRRS